MKIAQLPTLAAALLLSAAPTVTGFGFTGPSSSTPLDLNASSIEITWNNDNAQYSEVDLAFAHGSGGFSYNIAQNISTGEGRYTWNPANVSMALQKTQYKLTSGEDYIFKAMLHNFDSTTGATVNSGNYRVTGYPYISAAASIQPAFGAFILTAAAAMLL